MKTQKRIILNFERIKCHLFLRSAGYRILILKFREKHNLQSLSEDERHSKIGFEGYFGIEKQIYDDIYSISEKFRLPPLFVEKTMTYDIDNLVFLAMLDRWSLPIYIATSGHTLKEGFFIKILPHTSKATVEAARKFIHEEYRSLNKSLDPKEKKFRPRERDRPQSDVSKKIMAYVKIEENIYKRYVENGNKNVKNIVTDSILTTSEDEEINFRFKNKPEEELDQHLTNIYREVQRYYQIPSFTNFLRSSI